MKAKIKKLGKFTFTFITSYWSFTIDVAIHFKPRWLEVNLALGPFGVEFDTRS